MRSVRSLLSMFLRRILPLIAGLVALVLVIAWLAGTFATKIEPELKPRAAAPSRQPKTDVAREVSREYVVEAVGTLKAASRTQIASKVLETIEHITVTAGDRVRRGDVLIRLESAKLQARVRQAEQRVQAAEAGLEKARADYDRAREMYRGQAIPKSKFDAVKTHWEVARAEADAARQALQEAEIVAGYAVVTAPKAGRIVDRLAEPGDVAQPGVPLLVLYDPHSLRLEAPVQESLAVGLKLGDELPVTIDAARREVTATVDEIVPQADAASRSFLVKVSLPRTEGLYEGMFGRLRIPAGRRTHLCISRAAVQSIGQLEFVRVAGEDGRGERRFVRTGQPCPGGQIEILSGVRPGERVVLRDPQS